MSITLFWVSLFTLAISIILVFWGAYYFADPYLVIRGGASLTAVGALLVVFQILKEVEFETINQRDKNNIGKEFIPPVDRNIADQIFSERVHSRHKQRMRIVFFISIAVFIGELLHGWGDLIYKILIGI